MDATEAQLKACSDCGLTVMITLIIISMAMLTVTVIVALWPLEVAFGPLSKWPCGRSSHADDDVHGGSFHYEAHEEHLGWSMDGSRTQRLPLH